MGSEHVEETTEHVRTHPEAEAEHEHEDSKILAEAKIRDFSSAASVSSSSSSSSSPRSALEIDIDEKTPFDDSTAKSKLDGDQLCSQESVSPDFTAHTPQWSMVSVSPPVGFEEHISQMTSPPVQSMGHPDGYDPNRLPASMFSTKAANASEWSIASNDSLFSIHMGNNSFSRDLWKSGELSRLDEWNNSQSFSEAKYNEYSSLPVSLPPVMEHEEGSVKLSNASRLEKEGSNNSMKVAPEATKVVPPVETTLTSSSMPRLSEESGRSSKSFAFPILVSDGGKSGSLKGIAVKPEESQLQTQDSKATQKSSMSRWFSWFSCLPRCCS